MVEVEELIEVVGASIAEEMIVGVGMGASSENRLNAFIKMIDHVADLISSGDRTAAYDLLQGR
jgi:hypothetical protein